MDFKGLNEVLEFVRNEKDSWPLVQDLRKQFETTPLTKLMDEVDVRSKEEAINIAIEISHKILSKLKEMNVNFEKVEPGHGVGHLIRDYLHALRLAENLEADPKHLFIGILGGIFHDILGCITVKRYDENKRTIRHAEGGGIFFYLLGEKVDLSESERLLGFYSIAAHTCYLKPISVVCEDGITRESTPYVDLDESGKPIMAIWLARWTDRLDVNGPCFVGRHYLTLAESHADYDGKSFYSVRFQNHMNPFLRSEEEIKQSGSKTMREHITMFAKSQNNQSPYGKYDYGLMTEIRDSYTERLLRIIASFDKSENFSIPQKVLLLSKWKEWLTRNIEPTENAALAAEKLEGMFLTLEEGFRNKWYNAISATLNEYRGWAKDMLSAIAGLYEECFVLPVFGDIRKVLL